MSDAPEGLMKVIIDGKTVYRKIESLEKRDKFPWNRSIELPELQEGEKFIPMLFGPGFIVRES